jgi:septum formation protein
MTHPLNEKLAQKELILASASPRRQALMKQLGFSITIDPRAVEEVYPEHLQGAEIAEFLSRLKAKPFDPSPNQIVITSDTVVWHNEQSLAKAQDEEEGRSMLQALSGEWHEVISGLCITTSTEQLVSSETTRVKFSALTRAEIDYYLAVYQPFDKAGAYGIQEWIGMIGIEKIEGSYFNVVGLPVQLLYRQLEALL